MAEKDATLPGPIFVAGTSVAANGAADDEPDDADFGFDWGEEPTPAPTAAWIQAPRPTPPHVPTPTHVPVASADPSAIPARAEPYGWIRTKLAPGERWKRRLPKVCW
jgi:hypothetical protein